ncbi:MAG: adenosylcobinamide-GDP ribazoletransferase [Thermodesulfobacteriota bacterium]
MKNILSALRFFTILPLGAGDGQFAPRRLAASLPAAGLIVGLLTAAFDLLASRLWPGPAAAALDVVFLAVVSGALHLDGLADTADGLYGGKTRERALEIMKDSRTGAMGVAAVACCLLAKWAGIFSLDAPSRFLFLTLVPAYARGSALFGFAFLSYGRQGDGTGRAFFDEPLSVADFRWLILPAALSLLAGWRCLVLNAGFAAVVAVVLMFYKKRINGITGDMLGAMIEVTETLLFLAVATRLS